jgi:tight adherence protein C
MNIPLLIASLIGSSVLLTCFGISSHLRTRKTINERLKRVMSFDDTAPVVDTRVGYATPQGPVVRFLGALGEANKPQSEEEVSDVRRSLIQAGYRGPDTPLILFGAKLCLAIVLAGVFALIRAFALTTLAYMHTMLFFVLAAVIGFYTPTMWLQMTTRRRKRKIVEGFPDALDLMVVCVEAGLGLDAAISRVGEELQLTHPVLSEEFKLLKLELQVGVTREKALRNLGLRTDLEDINSLVALLIQTDRFGTSVAQALRVHSEAMRTRRYQRAEEQAAKLPVKLLLPLIFFIFPSLFIVILGPAVIQVIRILLPTLGGQ